MNQIHQNKNKIDNDLKKIANCDDLKSLHLEYGNQNKQRKQVYKFLIYQIL